MANRGERKIQKSISAPTVRGFFPKKQETFTPKNKPGAHNKTNSVPLSFAMRHLLEISRDMKETKKLLHEGHIKVNGKARKGREFAVGLFDIVEVLPIAQKYRMLFDSKGRLVAKKIDSKSPDFKISKVTGKRVGAGGKIWITTGDGYNIELKKEDVGVEDSVKISLPDHKILEVYGMDKGSSAFIMGGVHTGKTVKIEGIIHGSLKTHTVVEFSDKGNKFQTVIDNVFVIGKAKSEIEALT
ncbi:MAG TPA: hypothetical protein VJG83_01240 [archaeon]|nr:hypothetical protein [archaeon]